jgi:hypothetical protein
LREPNLGKTNPRVSLHYSLAICFPPSLVDSIIFLTLTRLVVVIIFENFSFTLFTPPSRRLSDAQEAQQAPGVVLGEFLVEFTPATVLFDSGASHSFIATSFVEKHGIPSTHLEVPLVT